jgi:kinesin family member 5
LIQQGAFSEKDEQLRTILNKLESLDNDSGTLSAEELTAIRRQLTDNQNMVRETVDRLRQSQEQNELIARRKDELESRVVALETEYEELLGSLFVPLSLIPDPDLCYRENHPR